MSITLGSNFQLNSNLPLDARMVVADLTARAAIPSTQRYDGMLVYVVATKTLYQLQGGILDANFVAAGGGSGTGSKNYVSNYNFETNATTGWTLGYNSATQNGFPTGTTPTFAGPVSQPTASISTTTTNPLSGTASLIYNIPAATMGDLLASAPFTIDLSDQAKVLSFRFNYQCILAAAGNNFSGTTSNSFQVAIWDITNSAWVQPQGALSMIQGTGIGIAQGTFQTAANGSQYRFCVYVTGTVQVTTMEFDDFFVGPQYAQAGFAGADFKNLGVNIIGATTTAPSKGTTSYDIYGVARFGENGRITGRYLQTAAGSAGSGDYLFSLPPGLSFDSNKVSFYTTAVGAAGFSAGNGLGSCAFSDGTNSGDGTVVPYDATRFRLIGTLSGGASASQRGAFGSALAGLGGTTPSFSYDFMAPIAGWSSNALMSNDASTMVTDVSATTSSVSPGANGIIICSTVVKDSSGAFNSSTGQFKVPISGDYFVNISCSSSPGTNFQLYKNGTAVSFFGGANSSNFTTSSILATNLNSGDLIDVRSQVAVTLSNVVLSIFKLLGPAAILASESVNGRWNSCSTAISGSPSTITFTSKDIDTHSAFNGTTLTIPVSGKYQFNVRVATTAVSGNHQVSLYLLKNGTTFTQTSVGSVAAGVFSDIQLNDIFYFNAGDFVVAQVSDSGGTPSIISSATRNNFSWARIGN